MDTISYNTPVIDIGRDAIQRSFDISPETVFGVLVGLLVIAILYLVWRLQRITNKLIDLNVSTISVLKDLTKALEMYREEIKETREHFNVQLENLKHDKH
jgi:methyl-accepting chemotaxis protein